MSSVDQLRCDCSFQNFQKEWLMDYWINPPKEKMKMIKELVTIESTEDGPNREMKMYFRMSMPLMSDRDNVMLVK